MVVKKNNIIYKKKGLENIYNMWIEVLHNRNIGNINTTTKTKQHYKRSTNYQQQHQYIYIIIITICQTTQHFQEDAVTQMLNQQTKILLY